MIIILENEKPKKNINLILNILCDHLILSLNSMNALITYTSLYRIFYGLIGLSV